MQVTKLEPPSVRLTARMLADDAIKPALDAARQRKVSAVERQHERIVQDRPIEPVRHDQVDSVGISMGVSALRPFVDPGEAMHPTFVDLAEGSRNRRRLQPVETGLQAVIVACTAPPPTEAHDFPRPCSHNAPPPHT